MSLITISADDIIAYPGGELTPATARLYANMDFRTSEGTFIAKGSPSNNSGFYQAFTASMNGNNIRIAAGSAYSTTDSLDHPEVTYSLVVFDANGAKIKTVFTNLRIFPGSPTTWNAIQIASSAAVIKYAPTYLATSSILALLSGYVSTALKAASVVFGVSRLTVDPVDMATPIAVGDNDPRVSNASSTVKAITKLSVNPVAPTIPIAIGDNDPRVQPATAAQHGLVITDVAPAGGTTPVVGTNSPQITKNIKVIGVDYATLPAAATAIGATATDVIIKTDETLADNLDLTTVGTGMRLIFRNGAKLTVAALKTLTVKKMEDPGNVQCFVQAASSSNIRFAKEAVEKINIAWFVSSVTTLVTDAIDQALASCLTNVGGQIHFPQRAWTSAGNHTWCSNLTVTGEGKNNTKLTATTINVPLFKLVDNKTDITVRGITLDGNNVAGTTGVLCTGDANNGRGMALRLSDVAIINFGIGFRILSTNLDWQMANVNIDGDCYIGGNTVDFKCNTPNTNVKCDAFFNTGANKTLAEISACGPLTFKGTEFAGNITYGTNQVETQTIVAAAGITGNGIATATVTKAGLAGSPITVDVPVNTLEHTTAALIAAAVRQALGSHAVVGSFFHFGGTGAAVELISLDRDAPDATMNLAINTGTATGITNNATSANTVAGVADTNDSAGFQITGNHGPITFIGCADEAYRNFIVISGGDADSIIEFVGGTLQGNVVTNATHTINAHGTLVADRAIRDSVTGAAIYNGSGERVPISSYLGGAFRTLSARRPTNFSGDPAVTGYGTIGFETNSELSRLDSNFSLRLSHNGTNAFRDRSIPGLAILSSVDPATGSGGNDWPGIRIGRSDNKGNPLYYYDIYRAYATGFAKVTGNQTGFKGWDFVDLAVTAYSFLANGLSAILGYATGAGGVVTQITSASTGITLNRPSGQITTVALTTAAGAEERFTVTSNAVTIKDIPVFSTTYNGAGTPMIGSAVNVTNGTFDIVITNVHGANALNALMVINFGLIRTASA